MRGNSDSDRNSDSNSDSDRNRGIQHMGMHMSLHIGTRNKAIAINFRQVRILCLSPYSLPFSVQIFYSVYIYYYNLEANGRIYYSLYTKSDWLAFFISFAVLCNERRSLLCLGLKSKFTYGVKWRILSQIKN